MAAPKAHAVCSASAAHRWIPCPGSVALSGLYPSGSSTIYADEGTLAHEAAEQLIKTDKVTAKHIKKIDSFYEEHPELKGNSSDMIEYLEEYAAYVKEEYAKELKEDPAAQLLTEQKVDLSRWIPEGFGTSDVVIVRKGRAHIIDLKYGKGVKVEAEENAQLMLYALGALDEIDMIYEVNEVEITIYQPRLDNISSAMYYADDLYGWGHNVAQPAAKKAMEGVAEFKAGEWCTFCPARKECRTRADHFLQLRELKNKGLLTPAEISEVLKLSDGLVKWADDVKEGALSRALEGEEFPGYKVVEGRSNRKYSGTDEEIVKQCVGAGYDRALLFETKLLTVSNMEKLMGKKQFADVLGLYIEKPPGKPTLVPDTDKRPAIVGNNAADDFADID